MTIESNRNTNLKAPASPGYQDWLQEEFVNRCRTNPSYSIRAFALYLKTDSSSLSQIISGKRRASAKLIARFADAIGVSPEVRVSILEDAKSKSLRNSPRSSKLTDQDYFRLSADIFNVMADWYHYAILELSKIENFKSEAGWIGRKLGISAAEAQIAMDRLVRLELATFANGKFSQSSKMITNDGSVKTSDAMKKLQRQIIEKALQSIDMTEYERKDITSMTMAIDEKKLPKAKELIKDFRRQMSGFLEKGKQNAVFNLAIQLYPLTKPINEEIREN